MKQSWLYDCFFFVLVQVKKPTRQLTARGYCRGYHCVGGSFSVIQVQQPQCLVWFVCVVCVVNTGYVISFVSLVNVEQPVSGRPAASC